MIYETIMHHQLHVIYEEFGEIHDEYVDSIEFGE
jgi:hypothetical protein